METETLQALMNLFSQLGAEAKWAFLAWLGFRLFTVIAIAGTILTLGRWIITAIKSSSDDTEAVKAIGEALEISKWDHNAMVRAVINLQAKRSA